MPDTPSSSAACPGCEFIAHEDGRDLCDQDGQPWPCSTVVGFAFIYGADVPEQWERTRA